MRNAVDRLLEDVVRWAQAAPEVEAVALVGSHARGQAGPASDVDLLLLTDGPGYLESPTWVRRFGDVDRWSEEHWGEVTSLRVWYRNGLEVEFGIAQPSWARMPMDPGTRRVVEGGLRVLMDRTGRLSALS